MALSANRSTPKMDGYVLPTRLELPVAAATKLYAGALVACNAAGNLVPASASAALTPVGRCEALADNTSGAAGDIKAKVAPGCFGFKNSGTDPIAAADRFATVYMEDDQTIGKTSQGGTLSRAGVLIDLDSDGVAWVLVSPYAPGQEDGGAPRIQSGTATLVAGTLAITAATISATSRIFTTMKDFGAGAITDLAALHVPVASRVVGNAGAGGSFTVTAVDGAKATIATAVCTFDWLVIG